MLKTIKLNKELKELKQDYRKTRTSLAKLRDENEECCRRIFKRTSLITQIKDIVEQNNYDNPEMQIRKIKELIRDFEAKN